MPRTRRRPRTRPDDPAPPPDSAIEPGVFFGRRVGNFAPTLGNPNDSRHLSDVKRYGTIKVFDSCHLLFDSHFIH